MKKSKTIIHCPQCDRKARSKGTTKAGSKRYSCPHQGCDATSFTPAAKPITGRPRGSVGQCPSCGSEWTKKSGKVGSPYALCNDCGKSFKLSDDDVVDDAVILCGCSPPHRVPRMSEASTFSRLTF